MTVSFNDEEMKLILESARTLPITSRDSFLGSIAEQMRPRRIDLTDAIRRALQHTSGEQNDAA